jgi:carboxyl-terminal processing protease
VVRRGAADVDVALTRTGVRSRSVHVRDLSDRTRVIRVDRFSADAAAGVEQAVLEAPRARGLVLDLRMNPGGRVDQAVAVAGLFLDAGPLATLAPVDAQGDVALPAQLRTAGQAITDLPLVVLVDAGSASAAELLTGALQDRGRAVVAGARTFGKGTVQILTPTTREGDANEGLTTLATYLTPDGRAVDGEGLLPDVVLNDPVSDADAFAAALAILAGSV